MLCPICKNREIEYSDMFCKYCFDRLVRMLLNKLLMDYDTEFRELVERCLDGISR